MEIEPGITAAIMNCVESLPLWSQYGKRVAVVLAGSLAAGFGGEHSDVDVDLLVPEPLFTEWYQPIWEAVDQGAIRILNPRARLFHEYPITYMPGVDGHYVIHSSDDIEARIRSMDDVLRWIHCKACRFTMRVGCTEGSEGSPPSILRTSLMRSADASCSPRRSPSGTSRRSLNGITWNQSLSYVCKRSRTC